MARRGSTIRYGMAFVLILSSVFLFVTLLHISSVRTIHSQHTNIHFRFSTSRAVSTSAKPETSSNDGRTCSYPSSYYDPWYKPLDSYEEVHLVFYKKNRMEVVARIAHRRDWILHPRTLKTLTDLETIVANKNSFVVIFTSSREASSPSMIPYLRNPRVLVTGIPYTYQFTGAKREQYMILDEHLIRHGCSIDQLGLMPSSYLMDSSHQCHDFFDQIVDGINDGNKSSTGLWLQKTSRGYGGNGISIIRNFTAFRQKYGACKNTTELIVQEYIPDLLLLDGRKFDIRVFVLISGTAPYMIFYHKGYLRVAIQPFDVNGPMDVHLTNTHMQSSQEDYQPDQHFWSFEKFQSYLNDHHKGNNDFVNRKLVPFTEALGVLILNSGLNILERGLSSGCQLLGLDIMVSTNLQMWFIEANNYPLWPTGGWMTEFTLHMGEDLFDLVMRVHQEPKKFLNMPIGQQYMSWRLVWREQVFNCEGHNAEYSPCQDLSEALYR